MKNGVYQIRNVKTKQVYIGSAACHDGFRGRWARHQSHLRKNRHHSLKLQNAWNKYGSEAFVFEILEECQPEDCLRREQHYLNSLLFASNNDERFEQLGYNVARISSSKLGVRHTEATKRKMRKSHTKQMGEASNNSKLIEMSVRQIKQMLISGVSQRKIAERFGVAQATIFDISSGRTWAWLE